MPSTSLIQRLAQRLTALSWYLVAYLTLRVWRDGMLRLAEVLDGASNGARRHAYGPAVYLITERRSEGYSVAVNELLKDEGG